MPDNGIVVLIPTYNERDTIGSLIDAALALGSEYRVIVIDDQSPDGTGAIVAERAQRSPDRIDLLSRPQKEGIGPAYIAGMTAALASNARFIATMDADLSHDPQDLPRLRSALDDADLALGSRYVPGGATEGWPRYRQLLSRFGGAYSRFALGIDIADPTGGFKMYRRDALASLDLPSLRSDGYVFQIETTYLIAQSGRRVVEVPITFVDRIAGKSKLSRRIVLEAMGSVWRLRFAHWRTSR